MSDDHLHNVIADYSDAVSAMGEEIRTLKFQIAQLEAHIGVLRGALQKIATETDAALEHSDYQLSMGNIAAIITRFRQENGHEQEEATLPSRQKIPLQGMPRYAIDWGKPGRPEDRILERDGNANSDLLRARTARFSVNKEPVPPPPRNEGERK